MNKKGLSKNLSQDVFIGEMVPTEIINIERKRIANELHDSLIQSILGILYKSQLCVSLIDNDLPRTKDELKKIYMTAKEAITETREIIQDLYSNHKDLPIGKLVHNYIERMKEIWGFEVTLLITNGEEYFHIKSKVKLYCLRLIQEAINNVNKHAQATHVVVEIKYHKDSILLIIKDDGVGFDINNACCKVKEQAENLSGYGLTIMKERTVSLGGDLKVISGEKLGTKIIIEIPKKRIEKGKRIEDED